MRRALVITAILAAVSACGRQDPVPPLNPLPPTVGWGVEGAGSSRPRAIGAIAPHVFVLHEDGTLRARDVATGDPCWERSFAAGTRMAVSRERVLVLQGESIDALTPYQGRTLWTTRVPVQAAGPPVAVDGNVVVAGAGLCLLSEESGERLWCLDKPTNLTAAVGLAEGLVLAADDGQRLYAFDVRDGSLRWTFEAKGRILTPPIGDGQGRVFVGTNDGWILGLDSGDGGRSWRWRTGADTVFPGIVLGDHVWFASQNAILNGLRRNNGNQDFRLALPSRPVGPPLYDGEAFVVPCYSTNANATTLMAFLAETGRRMGMTDIPGEMHAQPVLAHRRLIVAPRDGSLHAYNLAVPTPTPDETAGTEEGAPTPLPETPDGVSEEPSAPVVEPSLSAP